MWILAPSIFKSAFIICMNRTNILKRSNLLWWILCWIFTKQALWFILLYYHKLSLTLVWGYHSLNSLLPRILTRSTPKTHQWYPKQNQLKCLSTYFFDRFIFYILSLSRKASPGLFLSYPKSLVFSHCSIKSTIIPLR